MKKIILTALAALGLIGFGVIIGKTFVDSPKEPKTLSSQTNDSIKKQQAIVDDFFALNSKVSLGLGLGYVNYSQEVGKLQASLDQIERTEPNLSVLPNLKSALKAYSDAVKVWDYCNLLCDKVTTYIPFENIATKQPADSTDAIRALFTYNPPFQVSAVLYPGLKFTPLAAGLNAIWVKAKAETQKAQDKIKAP